MSLQWWMPIKEPTACIKCGDQLMQSQRISKRVDGPFPLVLVPQVSYPSFSELTLDVN